MLAINNLLLAEIQAEPHNFRALRRVPFTSRTELPNYPILVNTPVGDEISLIMLDTETTGLDWKENEVIELGLVKFTYSPSQGHITQIIGCASWFEEPKGEITPEITEITGITLEQVRGFKFDDNLISQILGDVAFVIAHNAQFDRAFFDKRFPQLSNLNWACSIKDIAWSNYGLKGNRLEMLLVQAGYFYDAHRADTDCLATVRLFMDYPQSLNELLKNAANTTYHIRCYTAPFHVKDQLKERGYRWDTTEKATSHWHNFVASENYQDEIEWLSKLCPNQVKNFVSSTITSKERYKV